MRLFIVVLSAVAMLFSAQASAQQSQITPAADLPHNINSGPFKAGHIQGIAVDQERKYVYYSYTTMLIKTDLEGNVIGSVTGL
ncbi:MAG: hypothetical protein IKZ11_02335, partial [Alistipes sp.]|nr:hypothetical protein [Alistipes sp.]